MIAARRTLAHGGFLAIHLSKEEEKGFPEVLGGRLRLSDRRLYGGSLLLFYVSPEANRSGNHSA